MATYSKTIDPTNTQADSQGFSQGVPTSSLAYGQDGSLYKWTGAVWERQGGSSGGSSSSVGQTSAPNFEDIIAKAIKMNQEAIKPAIASQEAAIPEIQSKYAQTRTQLQAEVDPLKARYDNLLSQIKGNQQVAEQRQTLTTSNEMAKRGILPSSGYFQQEQTNALNPITQQYTTLATDTALQREAGLRDLQNQIANLTPQEVADLRLVYNSIAGLQSEANTSGINLAKDWYGTDVAAQTAQRQREAMDKILKELTSQDDKETTTTTETSSTKSETQPKTTIDLAKQLGGYYVNDKGQKWTNNSKWPVGTLADGRTLYSDGSAGWTKWTFKKQEPESFQSKVPSSYNPYMTPNI